MGVMYDYFAAPSDAVAADMVRDSPFGPKPMSPALREALQARDRQAIRLAARPKVRRSDAGFLVLEVKGVDPVVQLGTLEALLTGEHYDVIAARPRAGHLVADRGEQGPWVAAVTDELQSALAAATPDQIAVVAARWAEDMEGEAAAHFLLELADLARQADQRGERLYCRICL